MPPRLLAAAGLLITTACAHQQLTIAPRELADHVGELRRTGRARVELMPHGTYQLRADESLRVTLRTDADVEPATLSVSELIAHCPDLPPFREDNFKRDPPCLLDQIVEPPVVSESSGLDWGSLGRGAELLGVVTIGGGLGVCAVKCDSPVDVAAAATLAVGITALFVVSFAALVSSGAFLAH